MPGSRTDSGLRLDLADAMFGKKAPNLRIDPQHLGIAETTMTAAYDFMIIGIRTGSEMEMMQSDGNFPPVSYNPR